MITDESVTSGAPSKLQVIEPVGSVAENCTGPVTGGSGYVVNETSARARADVAASAAHAAISAAQGRAAHAAPEALSPRSEVWETGQRGNGRAPHNRARA